MMADRAAYNTGYVNPPMYEPPQRASKTNTTPTWPAPPPGPPPSGESSRVQQQPTGAYSRDENSIVGPQNPELESSAPAKRNFMNRLNPFK